ncbi:hypothetical protein RchiOBHm_Chr7g0241911 [Rosa chinensis]|uniref:Cotton fiber protein n=1 Tax=Rosa chinensis TaxID=74649 RepID=A0A2P6PID9_ROSCH|nr:uncharacterized protein LOC112179174 [Rosa chinensis]PRQ21680.1 hypothetical protein RchiOBHm_Chr7g0241911 [Rosa chinensis]
MLAKKICDADRVGQRAWKLLRMAFIWARKGGVFKHRLMMELRVVPKFLKNHLGTNASTKSRPQIHYFEREFSFDKTPLFNLKMHRPPSMRFNIPCLNPPLVLHDDDDHLSHSDHYDEGRKSILTNSDQDRDDDGDDLDQGITSSEDYGTAAYSCANYYEDEAVDRKADEFIAKFYRQMKLQRQSSYTRYNDMLNRGAN